MWKIWRRRKEFYTGLLGLEVIADFGANVTLTGGIALQTKETWKVFIDKEDKEIITRNNATELYFEEDDIDRFNEKIGKQEGIEFVHEMKEHSWGQRVLRFYDPDKHIIEVGENLTAVIKRFMNNGLSIEQTAVRMDVPIEFIRESLEENK